MFQINVPIFSTIILTFCIKKIVDYNSKVKDSKFPINTSKPILLIDPFTTLLDYRFSLKDLNFVFKKRKYTEEFLFNLGFMYDIFFITDNSLINSKIYKFIDPLGIASFRYYSNEKNQVIEKIKKNNKVIVLESSETKDVCSINIKPFSSSSKDFELLDIVGFLASLNFMNNSNHTTVLKTFKNKDFFLEFDKMQRKNFKMKNMLNFTIANKYEYVKQKIYKDRIDYYQANKNELLN